MFLKKTRIIFSSLALLPLTLPMTGLAQSNTANTSSNRSNTQETPTDAQIVEIVSTANTGEIETAKLVQKRSTNKSVESYAKMMVTEHTDNNKKLRNLAATTNLVPQESELSRMLKADSEKAMEKLKPLRRTAFDKAYMDTAVADHQKVLNSLDSLLIPTAQNAELKQHLEKTREAVQKHLNKAQELQASLGKVAASSQ